MKEEGKDFVETGFKLPSNGWHLVEFQEGIDFLPAKGGEGVYQNERGFKTYKLPAVVKDETDPDNGADCSQLVGVEKGGQWMANILACIGLWDAIKAKYPGPEVSVFDPAIMDRIKTRLPGLKCMMKTELDEKDNRIRIRAMASMVKYKDVLKKEKEKALAGKKASPTIVNEKPPEAAPTSDEALW